MVRKKPAGWPREHARHVAAGKGIKTGRNQPTSGIRKGQAGHVSRIIRDAGVTVLSKPTGLARIGESYGYRVTWRDAGGGWVSVHAGIGVTSSDAEKAAKALRKARFKVTIRGKDLAVEVP